LSFSYPSSIYINDIYVSQELKNNEIYTNSSYKQPLVQNFSNYKSLAGKFSFSYPSPFILQEKDFGGSDILYHIDFSNPSKSAHGFVQVWNMPYSLKDFLEKSKSASSQDFKSFISKEITINGNAGYLWDYVVKGNDGSDIKGMEAFFKKETRMYRISYFVPVALWDKTQSKIFWDIVHSFKTY
jgi:hypothetical protein